MVVIAWPADDPARPQRIPKYALCLQEGKIIENRPSFLGVLLTTCKDTDPPRSSAWSLYVSHSETHTKFGCLIDCSQIHTIPKSDIKEYKYSLDPDTMRRVDQALQYGIGILKIEDLKKK